MNSAIYFGQVRHRRLAPVEHAFSYRMFMLYLDLAELPRVFEGRWLWSARRTALARFRREDHFGDPVLPLDECVRDLVARETGTRPDGPIRLLTHLRYLGHPGGAIYGLDQFAKDTQPFLSRRSPIQGLYFAGAWVGSGGFQATLTSGRSTARSILKDMAR